MELVDDTTEIETPEVIEAPVEEQEAEAQAETQPEEEGPLVVQIGDDAPEEDLDDEGKPLPQWGRELRKVSRAKDAKIKELERKLASHETPQVGALRERPTLDAHGFDDEAFANDLETWIAEKTAFDNKRKDAEQQAKAIEEAWQAKVASYNTSKASLPVADFDDAEAFVQDTFDQTQQGLLIKIAKDAPTLVYALGKNPAKATALAGIKDYAEFVAEAVRLEMSVKTTRKPATSPERAVSVPTGTGVATTDNTLERLREEAAKTGDYTKVAAYKRQKRA